MKPACVLAPDADKAKVLAARDLPKEIVAERLVVEVLPFRR
jgi:hypothetical protein